LKESFASKPVPCRIDELHSHPLGNSHPNDSPTTRVDLFEGPQTGV
jgi:hypothetical protein